MLPNQPAMLTETERKLFSLLALRELGSCTELQLLQFMVENDIMTYFDLSLALHELVSEGQAAKLSRPSDVLFEITPAGEEALAFFVGRLPHSKATLIRAEAPAWRERFLREKEFSGQVEPLASGTYTARLRLMDDTAPLMTIELPVPDRRLADAMVEAWPRCGGEVYGHLMRALAEAQKKP